MLDIFMMYNFLFVCFFVFFFVVIIFHTASLKKEKKMFTKLYCGHLCKMWIVNQRSRLLEDEKDIMINNVCMIEMMEGVRDQAKLQPFSWFGVCTVVFVVFIIIIHIIHDPPKKTDASFCHMLAAWLVLLISS